MSRKKEERAHRKAMKEQSDAEFDLRPPPPILKTTPETTERYRPSSVTSWVKLLEPTDEWFPTDRVEAYEAIRRSDIPKDLLAQDLRNEGFRLTDHKEYEEWLNYFTDEDTKFLRLYHELLGDRIWPPEVARAIWGPKEGLTTNDAEAIIRFLEICPSLFRSGYAKDRATARLKHCPLAPDHPRRISGILRARVELGKSRNMGGWLRLVRLSYFAETLQVVKEGLRSQDQVSVSRAIRILDRMVQERMFGETKVLVYDLMKELRKQELEENSRASGSIE